MRKIVDVATGKYGIPLEDIVIDPLAMPVGADTSLVLSTLETIRLVRDEFGLNMTLGASNVSFGMPDRAAIGSAFLPMASLYGLTSAIMDARSAQLVRAVKAADLLTNKDPWGASWIAAHRAGPGAAGADRDMTQGALTQGAADPEAGLPARVDLTFQPSGTAGAGPARRHAVRRRELERHRDRLHLRRPRHLQEVQDPDHRRAVLRVAARRPGVLARRAARRLAPGLPGQAAADLEIEVPPLVTRPKAATVGVGRQVILRPAAQKRYLELAEPSLSDQRTDLERVLAGDG